MWQGGYADQPYILMRELNTVIEAEIEMENIQALNAMLNTRTAELITGNSRE